MAVHTIKIKSGRRYQVRIRDANRRQISKTFKRKIDAEKWEREQLRKRDFPEETVLEESKLTFGDLVSLYQKNHLRNKAGSTKERYDCILRKYILPAFSKSIASDIRISEVDEWFMRLQLRTDLSPKSLNLCLTLFKGVFNWSVGRQFIETNPASPIKLLSLEEPEVTYWTKNEIKRFLAHMANDHYYPVFVIALNTGMRLNEITGLQWDMVDLQRGSIRVARTWCKDEERLKNKTKGKKPRNVYINETLRRVLAECRLRNEGPWVVTEPNGERFQSRNFTQRVFKPRCKEIGVRSIRFHDLRHTFASHFVMNGGDLYVLQKLLGHHSVTMTERYAHLSLDHLEGAAGVVEFGEPRGGEVVSLEVFQQSKACGPVKGGF